MPNFNAQLAIAKARQRGAMTILTIFIMLMAVGAFGVLGLGQIVWEREEVQRIADLAAKAAASDIDNASNGFQAARDYAQRNGLDLDTDSIEINCNVQGTDTLLPAQSCQQSALVRVTREVPAAFLGSEPVVAVAEATVLPFISGIVGTNLLALNLNNSGLSPLLSAVGTELRLNLLGFEGLLGSNAQVDLLELGVELGVFGAGEQLDMARLLNTEVSAAQLLNAALDIVGPDAPIVTIPGNGPIDTVDFLLSDILATDTNGNSQFAGASVRLGNLAFASSFAAATGIGGNGIRLNLGNTLNVSVLSPPQLFVATKRNSDGAVIATARTEQVAVSTRISGLLELNVEVGGGSVEIKDIDCRLPQSDSAVLVDLESTPLSAALRLPSLPLLGRPTVNANVGSGSANDVSMAGFPDPVVTTSYSFEASQGVGNLLTNLNSEIGLLGGVLNVLATNPALRNALGLLGGSLDEILGALGLEANEVVVQVDNMDCFNTAVLTR
ncbi:pilus assembly protein TadG-related protein [Limnobacter parvus]|uniref:Pilus assembly protein TadG-related protein n=1 Tax=Limnobacter parvus TaxID=2939690 RepID=A0ABT1XD33_9BURK|nr:pilus assembly protein TadG-related protein [Limnobacter parvus]MCR2745049.1 pilus assembly protein TadG-related protein [Limnobacter parvus]